MRGPGNEAMGLRYLRQPALNSPAVVLQRPNVTSSSFLRVRPWLSQARFVSYPKINYKVDPSLDAIAQRAKRLRPIIRIMDLILQRKRQSLKLEALEERRYQLAIRNRKINVAGYMRRYPNIFVIFTPPGRKQRWCKITQEMMKLVEEEKRIYQDLEVSNVQKLRKLLMISRHQRIPTEKIVAIRRVLGLPEDFLTKLVPSYPEFLRIVPESSETYLELVQWDESLAISEFERKVKEEAWNRRRVLVETRGKPLPFKVSLSPGMSLKKKRLDFLKEWQKLPYISPYEDWSSVQIGTPLSDKRIVALLHEFLSLTIERKVRLKVLKPFRNEFGLPQKVERLMSRFPGIFYMSQRGGIRTFILREGYYYPEHIECHPLVLLKAKYAEMVHAGPRMLTSQHNSKEASGGTVTGSNIDGKQVENAQGCTEARKEGGDSVTESDDSDGGSDCNDELNMAESEDSCVDDLDSQSSGDEDEKECNGAKPRRQNCDVW